MVVEVEQKISNKLLRSAGCISGGGVGGGSSSRTKDKQHMVQVSW